MVVFDDIGVYVMVGFIRHATGMTHPKIHWGAFCAQDAVWI